MITIRKAKIEDCKDVFDWRSDHVTVKMSHSKEAPKWDQHKLWFQKAILNKNILMFICEDSIQDNKIGVVRFDVNSIDALVSINLSPNMRGKGKSKLCLDASITKFKTLFPKVKKINAEIKKENILSENLFKSAGFTFYKYENNVILYYINIQ